MSDEIKVGSVWKGRCSGNRVEVTAVTPFSVRIKTVGTEGSLEPPISTHEFLGLFEPDEPTPVPEHAAHPVDSGAGDEIEARSKWSGKATGALYTVLKVAPESVTIGRGEDLTIFNVERGEFLEKFTFHAPPPEPESHATPKHYDFAIEPRKAIEAWGLGWNLGNVVKYVARCHRKGDAVGDLKKARDYLDYEIQRLEAAK